jgi:hypothetical protein
MAEKKTAQKPTFEVPGACLGALDDLPSARARLSTVLAAFEELRRYRELLRTAEEPKARRACPGLPQHLADRAYDAEVAYRVLARDCLDAVNLVRDSGNLPHALAQLARRAEKGLGPEQLAALLQEAAGAMAKEDALPKLDPAFVEEAARAIGELGLGVSARGDRVTLSAKRRDGKEVRREFATVARSGTQGRVGAAELFAGPRATGLASVFGGSLVVDEDCRSREVAAVAHELPTDLYGQLVGALATGRELMYRHARKVDEIGHGALEGEDPLTVVAVVVIIVGAVLLTAGVTIGIGCLAGAWGGEVCDYAWILIAFGIIFIAGGICVGVGACEFVIALFVVLGA